MKYAATLIPVVLVIAACGQGPQTADPSVITSRSDAWEAALNAPDIDALTELYTRDTRLMPPNDETGTGHEAVRAIFGGMIDAGAGGTTEIVEAEVIGDIGYIVGTYAITAGGEIVDTGNYTEIWKRETDGRWRIANDIWNSDRPVAVSEGPMTHLVITHEVDDADHWMAAWRGEDSRHRLFAANGAAHVHTLRSADNPNLTGLVIAVKDMDALDAMLQSEEGTAAAAEDGVRAETMLVLSEVD